MELKQKISEVQRHLKEGEIDGWLFCDHHGSNRFVKEFLELPPHIVLSRRFFFWIPKEGNPVALAHRIELSLVSDLPGELRSYLSWKELQEALKSLLQHSRKVALEYSPRNANPYVSVVDGGTIELVSECGVECVSSSDLLQHFTSVLDEEQIALQKEAANVLEKSVANAFELIREHVVKKRPLTEYEVQKLILSEFAAHRCVTEEGPICAVNAHSSLPHYMASKKSTSEISQGDFILIDLWCKLDVPRAVYADFTVVAVADSQATEQQQAIYSIVYQAQQSGIELIQKRFQAKEALRGYEVDDACRRVIEEAGYGACFTHRTGHNIDTSVHGAGAHLDNLETHDHRRLLPGTLCSIEPGIYLPDAFGVRLESNVVIHPNSTIEIRGRVHEKLPCLL